MIFGRGWHTPCSQSSSFSSSVLWSSRLHVGQVIQQDYRETTRIPPSIFPFPTPPLSLLFFPVSIPPPLIVLTSPDQTCPSLYRRHLLSGPSHRNFPVHFVSQIKMFLQTQCPKTISASSLSIVCFLWTIYGWMDVKKKKTCLSDNWSQPTDGR